MFQCRGAEGAGMGLESLWPRGSPRTSHPGHRGVFPERQTQNLPPRGQGAGLSLSNSPVFMRCPLMNGSSICGWSKRGALRYISWPRSRGAGMEPGFWAPWALRSLLSKSSWVLTAIPGMSAASGAKGQMDPVSAGAWRFGAA